MAAQFDSAWRSSYLAQLRALLPGQSRDDLDLLPFADTLAALGRAGEEPLGRYEVPVCSIVGSVARVGDFDRQLRPRHQHLRDRWDAVASVRRDLPPVRLIRLNDFYFVEDGHHRVSIARSRGVPMVLADVRRIRTIACANRNLTVNDLPAKASERMFLERVPLPDDVRVSLRLDDPNDWGRVADAAEAWGFRRSLDGAPITDRCELAEAWWAEEVMPVVEALRERGICTADTHLETYLRELAQAGVPDGSTRGAPTPARSAGEPA